MTVGNSARLLEAAQACFMSPFPSPAQRRAGKQGITWPSKAGPRLAAITCCGGPEPPSRPGSVRLSSVQLASVRRLPPSPCLSCHAGAVPSSSVLRWGCQAYRALNKAKSLHASQKIEKTPMQQAGGAGRSGTPSAAVPAGEKEAAPYSSSLGTRENTVFSVLKLIGVGKGVFS